jgi:hypothetical protein
MKEAISRNDGWRSASVAIVAMMALLISPFCGPLCAANACAGGSASGRANADDCHHQATPNGADALRTRLVAKTPCNSPDLPPATLGATKNWSSLWESRRASAPQFHSLAPTLHSAFSLGVSRARWRQNNSAAGTKSKATNGTVLRI